MSYIEIISDEEPLLESKQEDLKDALVEEEKVEEDIDSQELSEDETVFEAEEDDKGAGNGSLLAQELLIWIIQQCLMTAFNIEFAAAPGQDTFEIGKDDKVKDKFNRLTKILDAVKEEDLTNLKPVIDGKSSGSAADNAKYAQELIKACPKEHGDEIKEILKDLKDYLGNQVAAFKLN